MKFFKWWRASNTAVVLEGLDVFPISYHSYNENNLKYHQSNIKQIVSHLEVELIMGNLES